jgi:hypothetical protein
VHVAHEWHRPLCPWARSAASASWHCSTHANARCCWSGDYTAPMTTCYARHVGFSMLPTPSLGIHTTRQYWNV